MLIAKIQMKFFLQSKAGDVAQWHSIHKTLGSVSRTIKRMLAENVQSTKSHRKALQGFLHP